jgi:hypothetical protein
MSPADVVVNVIGVAWGLGVTWLLCFLAWCDAQRTRGGMDDE